MEKLKIEKYSTNKSQYFTVTG